MPAPERKKGKTIGDERQTRSIRRKEETRKKSSQIYLALKRVVGEGPKGKESVDPDLQGVKDRKPFPLVLGKKNDVPPWGGDEQEKKKKKNFFRQKKKIALVHLSPGGKRLCLSKGNLKKKG